MKKLKPKDLLKILNEREDVYCHVSTWIYKDNMFEPRIPYDLETYAQLENDTIDRVCVSSTLEGALQAIPRGGINIFDWYEDNALYFKVYIIDTLKLGIEKEFIYEPSFLEENNYVYDATFTKEHWILKSFEVPESDTFLINVKDLEFDKDNHFAIKNLKINTDYISKNEIVELKLEYLEEDYKEKLSLSQEKSKLKKEYLKMNPNIEFIDKDDEMKIIILAKEGQSIRKLMEFDSLYKAKTYNSL